MKILAIRGAGLASLREPFEVSLDQGALAHAGVFAIVGPTGAGKSTLLDTLFLALFGDTPRLTNQQRVRLPNRRAEGEKAESMTTRDARGLARGDVELAFAEVDFLGVDGVRYRSRWEVRRKRGGGAFKKPVHALSGLAAADESGEGSGDGHVHRIGGTKTEVLGHVVARLGLDFDQFRRSVVLAQGEIAAFLHAPDRDRAELLERITGTEIYGEISREIHLEAVRQRERAGLLVDQLAASSVMDAAERRGAEHAVSGAHLSALQAEQARQTDEVELERHQRTLELARERDEASAEVRALDVALSERTNEVRQVRSMRALGGLLPVLRAVERTADEVVARGEACAAAQAALVQAMTGEPLARSDRDAAQGARTAAHAEQEIARGALADAERQVVSAKAAEARARETMAHGAALAAQQSHAEAEQVEAWGEKLAAERAIASWEAQRARSPALDDVLARALEPDDALARADRIEREGADLEAQATRAMALGATLRAASERAERAVLDARERLEAGASRRRRAERQLAEALVQIEGASHDSRAGGVVHVKDRERAPLKDLRASDARPLMARPPAARAAGGLLGMAIETRELPGVLVPSEPIELDGLLKRCTGARSAALDAQRKLSIACSKLEQLAHAHARRRGEQARCRIDRSRFADELGRLQHELLDATELAEHAERALERALRTGHAAELRAHLIAGQPCDVCGATEHPRVRAELAIDAATGTDAATAGSKDTAAAADAETDTTTATITSLRHQRDRARALREQLASRHLVLHSGFALTLASSVEDPGDAARERAHLSEAGQLRAQQSEVDLALSALDDAEREARAAQSRVQGEQAASAEARARLARAEDELRACEQREQERVRRASALAEEAASLGLAVLAACAASAGQTLQDFLRGALASRSAAKLASARLDLLTARHTRADAQRVAIGAQLDAHREPMARALEACDRAALATQAAHAAQVAWNARAEDLARADVALAAASEQLAVVTRAIAGAEAERDRADAALRDATDRASVAARDLDEQVTRALPEWVALHPDAAPSGGGRAQDGDAVRDLAGDDGLVGQLLEDARSLSRCDPEGLIERTRRIEALLKARDHAVAVAMERSRRLQAHARLDDTDGSFDRGSVAARIEALSIALEARRRSEVALRSELSRCEHLIERDDVARAARADKASAVSAAQEELAVWEDLLDALGSADGKKLRVHAQRLTLRALVHEASLHLEAIAPRYAIEVVEGGDLAIQVSDRALGGEIRALGALSGGETFLVSLALALALRGLTSEQVRIASLFIDEGFGSLDAQSLDVVLSALDALEATGRQVGVVSHVPEVKERFAARIEVVPQGGGKSVVRVTA